MTRIFIVEDDETISRELKRHLDLWDYEVRTAVNFRDVLSEYEQFAPHLVLLDISLPFFNGCHWCREIRKSSNVPIIFISSVSDKMNIVVSMNMGGDDFVTKPFDIHVLTAKIQALLRRTYDFTKKSDTVEASGAVLNKSDATVTFNGIKIELTKNDFRILLTLMESKGSIVSREVLMEKLWETDSFVDENTLTVNITRLRKKLESSGVPEGFISTKKGLGYVIG